MNRKIIQILLPLTLICLSIYGVIYETSRTKESQPLKLYIGYSEHTRDKAYEDLLSSLSQLSKKVTDKTTKDQMDKIIADAEADQVILENFNREAAVKSLRTLFLDIGRELNPNIQKIGESAGKASLNDSGANLESQHTSGEQKDEDKPYFDELSKKLSLLDDEATDITDIFSEEVISKLYFSEEFEKQKFNRQFAASSLLIYYDLIASKDETLSPIVQDFEDIVYLDSRFMTAHIPLDLLVGSSTGIAFEMQYVDGDWKFNPYTAMMSLNLMTIVKQ